MSYLNNTDNEFQVINKVNGDEVSVVMSTDNNFIPFLAVAIKSLIENSAINRNYTIYILNNGISELNMSRILSMQTNNIQIRLISINNYLEYTGLKNFHICAHFSIANYFRIFIPQIFKNFEKVIYCDCDAIFLDDIAKIYEVDLGENIIGAVNDTEVIREIYYDKDEYFTNVLNLKNPYNYFNSGFLLFNIKNTLDYDLVNKCMKLMHKIKEPRYVDQCILNVACEDKVYFLDKKWNVENHLKIWRNNLKEELPSDIYNEYEDNLKNAYYLHFSGSLKPWHDSTTYNAHLWWEYARKTPFYEEILSINNKHLLDEQMILKNQIDSLNEQVILLKEQTLNICVDLSKLEYKINNKFYKNFWERIFSVKNDKLNPDKIHKVITILGIKLKIKK